MSNHTHIIMYRPLPKDSLRGDGVKLSPWTVDPTAEHCAMRFIEGTDPDNVANRVAFIEKTPRVRFRVFTEQADWTGWHSGWKGDDGHCVVARGWCDTHLQSLGYNVPDALPFTDDMLS